MDYKLQHPKVKIKDRTVLATVEYFDSSVVKKDACYIQFDKSTLKAPKKSVLLYWKDILLNKCDIY